MTALWQGGTTEAEMTNLSASENLGDSGCFIKHHDSSAVMGVLAHLPPLHPEMCLLQAVLQIMNVQYGATQRQRQNSMQMCPKASA